ncbi:MAG: UvrD-helicase domain-containing protein, partial [Victivallales bacterium]|nr:UvrD-helicase domain-containing protein [Victivallales bacterium]
RVEALVGQAPRSIGTFHGCCARFLRRDIDKLDCGRNHDFTIYDDDEQKTILKQCIKAAGKIPRGITPSLLSTAISNSKNGRKSIAASLQDDEYLDLLPVIEKIADDYEKRLQECNAVDFDDLLLLTVRLLEEVPGMADIYHNRFRYLLVDEYQDTNHLQYQLIMRLANEEQNVHVTGDPDQSIYSWRGADYHNIMSFTQDFPNARLVKLEQNYRSTPTILNAANSVIENNSRRIPKELFTENADGRLITEVLTHTDRHEAEWVVRKVRRLHQNGHAWRSCAVFYRTNAQSRVLEEAFVKAGIPYQLLGGIRFYERKEIKDFLALLRIKVNPSDAVAFERIFANFPICEGLGGKALAELQTAAALAHCPVVTYTASENYRTSLKGRSQKNARLRKLSLWLQGILEAPGSPVATAVQEIERLTDFTRQLELQHGQDNLLERRENVQSFLERAQNFTNDNPEADLAAFLEDVALVADVDSHDASADGVVLMTLHSSKGLEFPYVFIAGVEEGILPHAKATARQGGFDEDPDQLEEERRLFYVGITRAERAVYLSHVSLRFNYGGYTPSSPSRFLGEIPLSLVRRFLYRNGEEIPLR